MGIFSDMFEGFRSFVNDSLEAGRSSINTAVFSDIPHSCAYCICCKQTIKTTSFGKVIVFTCPYKDGSNYFPSNIPALSLAATDEELKDYKEKLKSQDIYSYINSICSYAIDDGSRALTTGDCIPIFDFEKLDSCEDVYNCNQYRPFIPDEYPVYRYELGKPIEPSAVKPVCEWYELSEKDRNSLTGEIPYREY